MGVIKFLSIGLLVCGFTSAAIAQDTAYKDVETIEIDDFIGSIEILTGQGLEVAVRKTDGANAAYPVRMNVSNGRLRINSDEDPIASKWWDDVNWKRNNGNAFERYLENFPSLIITLPAGTSLIFEDAVVNLDAGDTDGALEIKGGYIDGAIGNVKTADIRIESSADIDIGNVDGALTIEIKGSGDVTASNAKEISVRIQGSGDVDVANVAGAAIVDIHGSGDVKLGRIERKAEFQIHGSGDIDIFEAQAGLAVSVNGSGDVMVGKVNGETTAYINGSGDTHIESGRSENLQVAIRGSGSFRHDGTAVNPVVSAHGSGDIYIQDSEGDIRASGDGDIFIAGRRFGGD